MSRIPVVSSIDESEPVLDKGQWTDWGRLLIRSFNGLLDRAGGPTGAQGVLFRTLTMTELAQVATEEGRVLNISDLAGGAGLVICQADGHWYDCATKALVL
jgi:hypothetical protein